MPRRHRLRHGGVGGITLATLTLEADYWRASKTSDLVIKCKIKGTCTGGNESCSDAWCEDESNTTCSEGHSGPLCHVCREKYFRQGKKCVGCAGGSIGLTFDLPILALLVAFAVVVYYVLPRHMEVASESTTKKLSRWNKYYKQSKFLKKFFSGKNYKVYSKILVSLVQVLAPLGMSFAINFPPVYSSVVESASVIQLDVVQLMPLSCAGFATNFHSKLYFMTITPLVLVLPVILFAYCMRNRPDGSYAKWAAERLCTLAFFLVFLLYPGNSQKIFSTFPCTAFDDDDESRALTADLSIDCKSEAHTGATGRGADGLRLPHRSGRRLLVPRQQPVRARDHQAAHPRAQAAAGARGRAGGHPARAAKQRHG